MARSSMHYKNYRMSKAAYLALMQLQLKFTKNLNYEQSRNSSNVVTLNLSPENMLLILCGRTEIDVDISCKIKEILNHPLDWGIILDDAYYHRTMQLLYHGLEKSGHQNLVPQGIFALLRMVYKIYKLRNECYYKEARRVLESLQDAGINYVVYKGLFSAEKVYRDRALKPFNDVDLLISKKDKKKAHDAFSKLGYHLNPQLNPTKWNPELEEVYCESGGQLSYETFVDDPVMRNLDFGMHIKVFCFDVHYKLQPVRSSWLIDEVSVLKNAILTKLSDFDAFIPCYEDHLILLATHLYRHGLSIEEYPGDFRLFRFCDMNETIRHFKNAIDWQRFVRSVKLQNAELPVYYVLYFTEKMFGRQVPDWVIENVRPKTWEEEKDILVYDWYPLISNCLKVYGKLDFFYKLFIFPTLPRMFGDIPKPILNEMNRTLTERYNLKKSEDWEGSIQFSFPEALYWDYYIIVKDKKCTYYQGVLENPDVTVEMPAVRYMQLYLDHKNRGLDLRKIVLDGKTKVKGDIKFLLKMKEIFG